MAGLTWQGFLKKNTLSTDPHEVHRWKRERKIIFQKQANGAGAREPPFLTAMPSNNFAVA